MELEVGQLLSQARTQRGIELGEAERVTKIRVRYLRAMEEDRWEALPGTAYARGFLASYARYLGLDEGPGLEAYEQRFGAAEQAPIPEEMLPRPGTAGRSGPRLGVVVLAALVAIVAATVVVLGGGEDGGEGNRSPRGGNGSASAPAAGSSTTTTTTTTTTPRASVSVELRATAAVWVCLVADSDRELVDAETLSTGERRGPFEARAFEATFGNGSVELSVDGRDVAVPALAEPLGYRITPGGVERLAEAARPDCV